MSRSERHPNDRRVAVSAAALTTLLLWLPAPASAESGTAMQTGRGYFLAYCASCHGADARGDGPVSPAMKQHPSDLTRIAERRDGRFPMEELAGYISGKSAPAAHGTREMPVWGTNLVEEVGEGEEARLIPYGPLRGVLDYLESIQR